MGSSCKNSLSIMSDGTGTTSGGGGSKSGKGVVVVNVVDVVVYNLAAAKTAAIQPVLERVPGLE
jgi:hypothetical protein